MNRRDFLERSSAFAGLSLVGLSGCARRPIVAANSPAPPLPFYDKLPPLPPIRAHEERIFRITVCTRPFRAAGPRIETERVGDKIVVHNYGHGGSGWSLSWGSSAIAVEMALTAAAATAPEIAVVGCGALGLTSATLLQRAGARVTIYAKERPPYVRSSRATGSWTPDSRVALTGAFAPTFPAQWEQMARASWSMYQSYLGLAGDPVEYYDNYFLTDLIPPAPELPEPVHPAFEFATFGSRIADMIPRGMDLPPGSHPFPAKRVRRTSSLMFNIADYSRQLVNDFLIAGGRIETVEFHSPAGLATLPQRVVVNCPGYAARQLWNDQSLTPVRGQIAWLIPQPEVRYGLYFDRLNILGRRDGIVVQSNPQGDATGWNDYSEQPDLEQAKAAVRQLAALYARMSGTVTA